MNFIFACILTASSIIMLITSPDSFLQSMILGSQNALNLSIKLTAIYAVWLSLFNILEKSNVNKFLAKILKPFNKFLFGNIDKKAEEFISLNISANVLGMSGATTPMGIKSIQELEKHKNTHYAICMFFVINATSVQIIPSSILALRISMGSNSPSSIILPTILATLLSTIIGVILVKVFVKKYE